MSKRDIVIKDFFDILNTHLEQNTIDAPMEIGKVTSISPLVIELGDLPLYESNIYMNKYLLAWDEEITVSNNDSTIQTVTIHHPSKLQINSYVGLYGLEWNEVGKTYQKYILINVIN